MQSLARYYNESKFAFSITGNVLDGLRLFFFTHMFHLRNYIPISMKGWDTQGYTLLLPSLKVDTQLRLNCGDYFVFYEILMDESYTVPTEFSQLKKPNIIDLGGNVGLTTLYFKSLFSDSSIFVVEADEDNFTILSQNCAALSGVTCCLGAAWKETTVLEWHSNPDAWGGKVGEESTDRNIADTKTVQAYSMNDIIDRANFDRVDILKIDIEGAEEELFQNCSDWIDRVDLILIELHGSFNAPVFSNLIKEYGFEFFDSDSKFNLKSPMAIRNTLLP